VVQHRASRTAHGLTLTLFHADPDAEGRAAWVRARFPNVADGPQRLRDLVTGREWTAEGAVLRHGIDLRLAPKGVWAALLAGDGKPQRHRARSQTRQ
jgi:hypothetical protein